MEKRYKTHYGEPDKKGARKGQPLSPELQAKLDALKVSIEKAAEAEKGEER